MMNFAQFMSSPAGRALRVVAGAALILIGLLAMEGAWGIIVALVGLVPLVAGAFDFCLIGALFGAPLRGKDVRAE
jgi:hypothetical protein